jgi:hypothetical protein
MASFFMYIASHSIQNPNKTALLAAETVLKYSTSGYENNTKSEYKVPQK